MCVILAKFDRERFETIFACLYASDVQIIRINDAYENWTYRKLSVQENFTREMTMELNPFIELDSGE